MRPVLAVALILLLALALPAQGGWVRLFDSDLYPQRINLVPDAGGKNVSLFVYGGLATNYSSAPAGSYKVYSVTGNRLAGSVIITNTSYHTFVWWALAGAGQVTIATDTFNSPASPYASVRAINVLPDFALASVVLNSGWSFGKNEFYAVMQAQPKDTVGAYLDFPPARYNAEAWDQWTNSVTPLEDLYAVAGKTYTLIAGKRYLGPYSIFILEDTPTAGSIVPALGDYRIITTTCS